MMYIPAVVWMVLNPFRGWDGEEGCTLWDPHWHATHHGHVPPSHFWESWHIIPSDGHRTWEGDRSCDHFGPRQSLVSPLKQQDLSQHSSCIPVSWLAPLQVLLPAVHCWEEEPHQPVQPGDPDGEQCVLPSTFCLQQWLF